MKDTNDEVQKENKEGNSRSANEEKKEVYPMIAVPEAISISIKESLKLVENKTNPANAIETIPILPMKNAMNRVLAQDVIAPEPGYPSFRASIMDGYAIHSSCVLKQKDYNFTHEIIGSAYAGESRATSSSQQATLPTATYITTGAYVPEEYDCVVPIEECRCKQNILTIKSDANISSGKWIRQIGSDIAAGTVLVKANEAIKNVAQLAVLLQCNISSLKVYSKIKIGVFSTGSELDSSNNNQDSIPDINRPMLLCLIEQLGAYPVDLGIIPDSPQILETQLSAALNDASLSIIVTTGGVSMGERDYLLLILKKLGAQCQFGRLHMKPGKPTKLFNYQNHKLILALPGNPVSAFVCTHLLLVPILNILHFKQPTSFQEALVHSELDGVIYHGPTIALDAIRPEYHRVSISFGNNSQIIAKSTGMQRSSRIASVIGADGFMVLPQACQMKKELTHGDQVLVLYLNNKFITVKDSKHMKKKKKEKTIYNFDLLYITQDNQLSNSINEASLIETIKNSLGKYYQFSNLSTFHLSSLTTTSILHQCKDKLSQALQNTSNNPNIQLVLIIVQNTFKFQIMTGITNIIKTFLDKGKPAEALAQQARRGAAKTLEKNALFHVQISWFQNRLFLVLPEKGVIGALSSLDFLIGHAIKLSLGAKDAHHTHDKHHHHKHHGD